MERGESLPRTDTLLRLAGGLGVPVQELVDGLVWTPPEGVPSWGLFRVTSRRPAFSGGAAVSGLSERGA
jgi:hypothetical protein